MTYRRTYVLALCLAGLWMLTGRPALAQHDHEHGHNTSTNHEEASNIRRAGDPYLLSTDPVSGEPLPDDAGQVVIEHDGREFRFANQDNADTFLADPTPYIAKVDAQMIDQQLPYYPLATCPISKEPLDVMGEPVNLVYKNRLVRFCCKSCKGEFLENPDPVIQVLDEAVIAAQRDSYPLETCVVSGESLKSMGEPVDRVYGNRLVRFCCKSCPSDFNDDPARYLSKLDAAAGESTPGQDHEHGEEEAGDAEHEQHH